jgi:delta-aminolevulinic acid dehydratase/porphobilinogen synthase
MVRETTLAVDDLVYPLFAVHGRGIREAIESMPGVFHLSVDEIVKEAKDAAGMGDSRRAPSSVSPRTRTRAGRRPTPRTASCSRRCAR